HDVRGVSTVDFGPTTTAPVIRPRARLAWPMFGREATRQAAAAGVGVRPPFRRVWVAGGRSLIEFPPAVGYGRIFFGDGAGRVIALDAFTGRRLWTFAADGAIKGGLASSGSAVFAGSYDGHVYALDAASGRLLWRASAQPRVFGHGRFYSTPAVAYGRVYVG